MQDEECIIKRLGNETGSYNGMTWVDLMHYVDDIILTLATCSKEHSECRECGASVETHSLQIRGYLRNPKFRRKDVKLYFTASIIS